MSLFKYLMKRTNTAAVAKERLQIIISHERSTRNAPDYLPKLQEEILAVIARYVPISRDQVSVTLERMGHHAILELNATMPDEILEEA